MGYRSNVQAACDAMGITNPIQEVDLTVSVMKFISNEQMTTIESTDMNRAGRLFFQMSVDHSPEDVRAFVEMDKLKALKHKAAEFFAENWVDAETAGRQMLTALKRADLVIVEWKQASK